MNALPYHFALPICTAWNEPAHGVHVKSEAEEQHRLQRKPHKSLTARQHSVSRHGREASGYLHCHASCSSPSNVRSNLCPLVDWSDWTVAFLSTVVLSCSQTSLSGRQQEGWIRDDGQSQQEWQAKHVWLAALASLADLNLKLRCS
jgi:hypothetical protein